MYYVKYFLIASILGFISESILYGESGILYGPYTPVYGIGSVIILLISEHILKKRNIKPFFKFLIIFVACTLLLTLTELVGGLLIENVFGYSFWDYTDKKYNIGKYICLEMALLWGISSLVFVCVLRPVIDVVIKKIPNFLIYIVLVIFVIDVVFTFLVN